MLRLAATPPVAPPVPRVVFRGRFAVQAKIHKAPLGDIWLCRDLHHDNHLVAVKQVGLDFTGQPLVRRPQLDNPWNESHTLNTLRMLGPHENILQVRQQFQHDASWCMVMEYCDGGDLWQTLEREPHNRLPEAQVLPLFAQIVRGVGLMHSNGIAHRDLSLENVLLSRTGGGDGNAVDGEGVRMTAKICGFGLSTKTDRICRGRVGKSYSMAPEVVAGAAYDPRAADVWSLGIMLFVLLTGSPLVPIASEKDRAFAALKAFGIFAFVDAWNMGDIVSLFAADLLVGMLQLDPRVRFTVEDVASHPVLQFR